LYSIYRKGLFKEFYKTQTLFCKVKTTLEANYLFLNICHFTGPQHSQNVLNTNTLKCQMHKHKMDYYSDTHHINSQ